MFDPKVNVLFDRMITLGGESVKHIQNADICKKLKTLHSLRSSKGGGWRRGRQPMFDPKPVILPRQNDHFCSVLGKTRAKCKNMQNAPDITQSESSKGGWGSRSLDHLPARSLDL